MCSLTTYLSHGKVVGGGAKKQPLAPRSMLQFCLVGRANPTREGWEGGPLENLGIGALAALVERWNQNCLISIDL